MHTNTANQVDMYNVADKPADGWSHDFVDFPEKHPSRLMGLCTDFGFHIAFVGNDDIVGDTEFCDLEYVNENGSGLPKAYRLVSSIDLSESTHLTPSMPSLLELEQYALYHIDEILELATLEMGF